jgi:hypothetical protein
MYLIIRVTSNSGRTIINVQQNTYHKRKYININITVTQQGELFNIYLIKI